jgi:eukaryotic-like serine/threonine-protein kinase
MSDKRWGQVSRLFHAARALDADARAAFLAAECGRDAALRREVESLLAQPDESWQTSLTEAQAMAEPMSATMIGRQIGGYRLQVLLGAGGMGEVYRARDLKLGRDVAVKVLPRDVMSDPDRLARFEREARVLAALNHPNIATIHGIEEMDGSRAIVMELIEGETLADRIARSPLSLGEALPIARQLVEALDTAHEKGIVHRDLKPANITLSPSGVAKVLDFGLAKLDTGADLTSGAAIESQAPTVTRSGLVGGRVLGTLPYMSPEQARGAVVDKRTDIWAFGCVLYEMLTGKRPFRGATIGDTLVAILEREPDLDALPAATPPHVLRLIRRCLERDMRLRLRDIGDARVELDVATVEDSRSHRLSQEPSRRWRAGALIGAAAAGAALAAVASLLTQGSPVGPESAGSSNAPVVFTLEAPDGTVMPTEQGGISPPALSPDGQTIANIHRGRDGVQRIWIQRLDGSAARELRDTDGATYPFWSYDGRAIGFFAQSKLKRVNAIGDGLQVLADTHEVALGGTWNARDQIVYSDRQGLFEISAAPGGAPRQIAGLDASRQEDSLRFPYFLPDGRHFLFVARSGQPSKSSAYVGSLDGPPTRLFETHSSVAYSPPGHLLYLQGRTLVARQFNADTLSLGAETVDVADDVGGNSLSMMAAVSVSRNGGALAYSRFKNATQKLQWVNRRGEPLETVAESRSVTQFKVAPDGKRIVAAFQDFEAGTRSLWIFDLDRQWRRLTSARTHDWEPVWSPNGMQVAFASYRDGPANLFVKAVDGSGSDEKFLGSTEQKDAGDWSPDGRWFCYRVVREGTRADVWVQPWSGDRKPFAVAATQAQERDGRFSPDSRWIAYESDENGPIDIQITRVPPTGDKWPVSYGGGAAPTWSGDGRELFFVTPDGALTAVSIDTRSGSPVIGPPTPLFHLPSASVSFMPVSTRYEVSRDAQRFLINVPLAETPPGALTVVLNWPARVKK